jgi:hypothetical protein
MGRQAIGNVAMSATERSRRHRERRRVHAHRAPIIDPHIEQQTERVILSAFQQYLNGVWPGWRRDEGRLMYSTLWRAFAAGWKARP